MNSLTKTIQEAVEKSVSDSINNFFKKICNKWEDVTIEELQLLWNDEEDNMKVTKSSSKQINNIEKNENSSNDGCPYVFSKGDKEGTNCGIKPKNGCEYCSKHQKFEGVGQDTKKKYLNQKHHLFPINQYL